MIKVLFIVIFTGFATQLYGSENTLYEETMYNKPGLGSETEVYLGDRMLSQEVGEWRECITPKKSYTKEQKLLFLAALCSYLSVLKCFFLISGLHILASLKAVEFGI